MVLGPAAPGASRSPIRSLYTSYKLSSTLQPHGRLSNTCVSAEGTSPGASLMPIMLCVLPAPVMPYAISTPDSPRPTSARTMGAATAS